MPQDKLFEMPPEPEPAPERPDLDRDNFTPGATVPPQRELSPFQPPEQIRGVPTEAQQTEIEHLEDQGFGTIQARKRVLGADFIDPGLPPGVDIPERARNIKPDRRRLSPSGKIAADEPTTEHQRAIDAQSQGGEGGYLDLPAEEKVDGAENAKRILDQMEARQDREE